MAKQINPIVRAIATTIGPVKRVYGRFLEKPLRAGAEAAACLALLGGGWTLLDSWLDKPSRTFLADNGYSLDTESFHRAIRNRDSAAVGHFRRLDVEPPSSASLCSEYGSLADLEFLLDEGLVTPRVKCGSAVSGTIDTQAMRSICTPWDGVGGSVNQEMGANAMAFAKEEIFGSCGDPYSDSNLGNIVALAHICESMDCPQFDAFRKNFANRLAKLRQVLPPAPQRQAWLQNQCLTNNGYSNERVAALQSLLRVRAVPLRNEYDYGGQSIRHSPMIACEGPSDPEWPDKILPTDWRYGVRWCSPIPVEQRARACAQQWPEISKQLATLDRLEALLADPHSPDAMALKNDRMKNDAPSDTLSPG